MLVIPLLAINLPWLRLRRPLRELYNTLNRPKNKEIPEMKIDNSLAIINNVLFPRRWETLFI